MRAQEGSGMTWSWKSAVSDRPSAPPILDHSHTLCQDEWVADSLRALADRTSLLSFLACPSLTT
eukprot:325372-Rhodomonas_salina.1